LVQLAAQPLSFGSRISDRMLGGRFVKSNNEPRGHIPLLSQCRHDGSRLVLHAIDALLPFVFGRGAPLSGSDGRRCGPGPHGKCPRAEFARDALPDVLRPQTQLLAAARARKAHVLRDGEFSATTRAGNLLAKVFRLNCNHCTAMRTGDGQVGHSLHRVGTLPASDGPAEITGRNPLNITTLRADEFRYRNRRRRHGRAVGAGVTRGCYSTKAEPAGSPRFRCQISVGCVKPFECITTFRSCLVSSLGRTRIVPEASLLLCYGRGAGRAPRPACTMVLSSAK